MCAPRVPDADPGADAENYVEEGALVDSQPPTAKAMRVGPISLATWSAGGFARSAPMLSGQPPPPPRASSMPSMMPFLQTGSVTAETSVDSQQDFSFSSLDSSSDLLAAGAASDDDEQSAPRQMIPPPYTRVKSEPFFGGVQSGDCGRPEPWVNPDKISFQPLLKKNSSSSSNRAEGTFTWFLSRRGGGDDNGEDGDLDQCRNLLKSLAFFPGDNNGESSATSESTRKRSRMDDQSHTGCWPLNTEHKGMADGGAKTLYSREGRLIGMTQANIGKLD